MSAEKDVKKEVTKEEKPKNDDEKEEVVSKDNTESTKVDKEKPKNDDDEKEEDKYFNKKVGTETIKLNDGTIIPRIGLGTYLPVRVQRLRKNKPDKDADKKEEDEFRNAVQYAVKMGYRHIDSAQAYTTEIVIGQALQYCYKNYGIKREDIWLTTKIDRFVRTKEKCIKSLDESLKNLQTKYIDLVLIHSPHSDSEKGKKGQDVIELWKVLMKYKKDKKIGSIGVSNFGIGHLKTFDRLKLEKPSVNQIEITPFLNEKELIEYCEKQNIVLEAYTPISQAKDFARKNKYLNELAKKHSTKDNVLTWAHIMLKWGLQKNFIILPKSTKENRIKANSELFNFELTKEEMKKLNNMDLGGKGTKHKGRVCWYPLEEHWDV